MCICMLRPRVPALSSNGTWTTHPVIARVHSSRLAECLKPRVSREANLWVTTPERDLQDDPPPVSACVNKQSVRCAAREETWGAGRGAESRCWVAAARASVIASPVYPRDLSLQGTSSGANRGTMGTQQQQPPHSVSVSTWTKDLWIWIRLGLTQCFWRRHLSRTSAGYLSIDQPGLQPFI